jgi:hypothetical protein
MNRPISTLVTALLLLSTAAIPCGAAVNVERRGAENPMQEVAKSVLYGALAGVVVGGAIALVDDSGDDGDFIRWGLAGGTVVGLGVGIWYITTRPSGAALLEYRDGTLRAGAIAPTIVPGRGARISLISARF